MLLRYVWEASMYYQSVYGALSLSLVVERERELQKQSSRVERAILSSRVRYQRVGGRFAATRFGIS
jgi:hypothetical protein